MLSSCCIIDNVSGIAGDIKGEDYDLFVSDDDCPEACLVIGVELGGLYFTIVIYIFCGKERENLSGGVEEKLF